jgi:hypothetical protein
MLLDGQAAINPPFGRYFDSKPDQITDILHLTNFIHLIKNYKLLIDCYL